MIDIFQDNRKLMLPIQRDGCALLTLLWFDRAPWTPYQINSLYKAATFERLEKDLTVMRSDCYINSWTALMDLAGIEADLMSARADLAEPVPLNGFSIGRWFNKRTGYTHFVGLDDSARIVYDSLRDSLTVREGAGQSKLLFSWRT
jgi:hypothetical protein